MTRRPPCSEEKFAAELCEKHFTVAADYPAVLHLYRQTLQSVIGKTKILSYKGLKWGDDAQFCKVSKTLNKMTATEHNVFSC